MSILDKKRKVHKNKGIKKDVPEALKAVRAKTQFKKGVPRPKGAGRKKKQHSVSPADVRKMLAEMLADNHLYIEKEIKNAEGEIVDAKLVKKKIEMKVAGRWINNLLVVATGINGDKASDAIQASKVLAAMMEKQDGSGRPPRQPLVLVQNNVELAKIDTEQAALLTSNIVMPEEKPEIIELNSPNAEDLTE